MTIGLINVDRTQFPNIARIFAAIHWHRRTIRFAADTWEQIEEVENAMSLIDGYSQRPKHYIYTP